MRLWTLDPLDVRDFDGGQCARLRALLRTTIQSRGWKVLEDCPVRVQALVIELQERELDLQRLTRLF